MRASDGTRIVERALDFIFKPGTLAGLTLLAAGGGSLSYDHHEPHGLRVTLRVPRTSPTG